MPTYVALLRGVNMGGKHLLPMADLAAMFHAAGCAHVRTYIQSGNVLFTATAGQARTVPAAVSSAIAARYGFRLPVLLRSAQQLCEIIRRNPYLAAGAPETALHVLFLDSRPEAARTAALRPDRSPPDTFLVRGREIYLHCPNGAGTTKLTNAWFDSALATISTGRNWRTVCNLYALARGLKSASP